MAEYEKMNTQDWIPVKIPYIYYLNNKISQIIHY